MIRKDHPEHSRADIDRSVQLIHKAITNALAKRRRVEIRGFGSFFLSHRPARTLRNPRSGKPINVPERAIPRFKAGKHLKQQVDKKGVPFA